jgi:hypothetical protein
VSGIKQRPTKKPLSTKKLCTREGCTGRACPNLLPCGLCLLTSLEVFRVEGRQPGQATIAALLGVDERTVRRDEVAALAKLRLDAAARALAADTGITVKSSTEKRPTPGPNVRSKRDLAQTRFRASRAAADVGPHTSLRGDGVRGALIPGDPMTMNRTLLCKLAQLKTERAITAEHEQQLIAAAATGDPSRFDAEAARVTAAAPARNEGSEPDAYEVHKHNPDLPLLMRWTRVELSPAELKAQGLEPGALAERRITAADVAKHGLPARKFVTLPNLAELAAATAARGDRMGGGK